MQAKFEKSYVPGGGVGCALSAHSAGGNTAPDTGRLFALGAAAFLAGAVRRRRQAARVAGRVGRAADR